MKDLLGSASSSVSIKRVSSVDNYYEIQKFTETERENRVLLEKISKINSEKLLSTNPSKKTLNYEKRKKELHDITIKNQALLERLLKKKSNYNIKKWLKDSVNKNQKLTSFSKYKKQPKKEPKKQPKKPKKLKPIQSKVLYKKGIILNNKKLLVEISRKQNVEITAFELDSPHKYCLELDVNETLDLMNGIEDYQSILCKLQLYNDQFLLLEKDNNVKSFS